MEKAYSPSWVLYRKKRYSPLGKLIQEGVDVPVGEGKIVFVATDLVAVEVVVTGNVELVASIGIILAGIAVIGLPYS